MKTLTFLSVLLAFATLSSTLLAADRDSDRGGNRSEGGSDRGGGNAIVCFDNPSIPKAIRTAGNPNYGTLTETALKRVTSIELLDVYQAKLPQRMGHGSERKHVLVAAKPNEKADELAERILSRIENYAPGVYDAIHNGYWALRLNTSYAPQGVAPIDDTNMLFQFDRNLCVMATMARQDANNDELFIDSRLFNHRKHSVESRAALLVHEWVYYGVLRAGVDNSAGVRSVVGKLITDEAGRVVELIDAAVKAKLISSDREKLNGIQQQMADLHTKLKEKLIWTTDFNWYTGECPETLCSTFWKFRADYEEEMYRFPPVQCHTLDQCEAALAKFVEESSDPVQKKQAERLLSSTRNYLDKLRIFDDLSGMLPVEFKAHAPGSHSEEKYPLAPAYLTEAKERFEQSFRYLGSIDSFAVNWAPLRRYDNFADYQAAMRRVRDVSLERLALTASGDIERTKNLDLPYFQ